MWFCNLSATECESRDLIVSPVSTFATVTWMWNVSKDTSLLCSAVLLQASFLASGQCHENKSLPVKCQDPRGGQSQNHTSKYLDHQGFVAL